MEENFRLIITKYAEMPKNDGLCNDSIENSKRNGSVFLSIKVLLSSDIWDHAQTTTNPVISMVVYNFIPLLIGSPS